MTLFLAYILMDHIGGFSTTTYIQVFILWIAHVAYHHSETKKG